MDAISHRGPDAEGSFQEGAIALGSRRLSIIDLDGGQMPIANEDNSLWIVQNGEIYNYRELRHQLQQKGHQFRSQSDTEVILHLYEEYGVECLSRLRGMFAFAIWDSRDNSLFIARDRIGQKPLFYANLADRFYFASEIKSLLASGDIPREMDYQSLSHYLSLRFIPPPGTMLKHISKLPPGHYLQYKNGRINVQRYWQINFREKTENSDDHFIASLEEKLAETIESHLVSDVPVGAFLSGGLDSSIVVAIMSGRQTSPFHTFAVGSAESSFDETPYARAVADHYQTRHHETTVAANLVELLPKMIWHLDEPSDPIAACMFAAAQLASNHVKVVLGGDGGDELFAGFDRYLGLGKIDVYSHMPAFIRETLIGRLVNMIPENFAYKSLSQKIRWVQQLSALQDAGERYAEATFFFRFNQTQKQHLFNHDFAGDLARGDSRALICNHFYDGQADSLIDRMIYTDMMTRLPEHTLMLSDRMTMAHSLELRSPLLDHELVEIMAAIPDKMKIRGKHLKYILRQLSNKYLPSEIVKRPKQGFMFPIAYWLRNELHDFLKSTLLEGHFVRENIFDKTYISQLIEEHRQQKFDHHVRLWMLLNIEIWHQLYIVQKTQAALPINTLPTHQI